MDEVEDPASGLRKKIAQLNKVVEYLIFHLEEEAYQRNVLRQRYEDTIQNIITETASQVKTLYKVSTPSVDGLEELRIKFNEDTAAIKKELSNIQKQHEKDFLQFDRKISGTVGMMNGEIMRIMRECKRQIDFFSDDRNLDPNNNKADLRKLSQAHQAAIDAHDAESKRKQEIFEKTSNELFKQMTDQHNKKISDMWKRYKPNVDFMNTFGKHVPQIRDNLKAYTHQMMINRVEVISLLREMKKNCGVYHQRKEAIIDEMKDIRRQTEQGEADHQKELDELDEALNNELEKKKKQERDHELIILAFNDRDSFRRQLQEEIDELKGKFKIEIQKENEKFEELKEELQLQIADAKKKPEAIQQIAKLQKEKKKLNQPIPDFKLPDMTSEIAEVLDEYDREYNEAKTKAQQVIDDIDIDQKEKYASLKTELKSRRQPALDKIHQEYESREFYEKLTKDYMGLNRSLHEHFEKMVIPDRDRIAKEYHDSYQARQKLKTDVDVEKTKLIYTFEDEESHENARHAQVIARIAEEEPRKSIDDIIRENCNFLDTLSKEIAGLEAEYRIITPENDDVEISKARNLANHRLKEAQQQTTEQIKSLISQIAIAQEEYATALHEERSSQNKAQIEFQAASTLLKSRIKPIQSSCQAERTRLEKEIQNTIKESNLKADKVCSDLQKEIYNQRIENSDLEKTLGFELDMNAAKLCQFIEKEQQLREQGQPKADPALDTKIANAIRQRDRAMQAVNTAQSRPKEKKEIDNLEYQLSLKTSEFEELNTELENCQKSGKKKGKGSKSSKAATMKGQSLTTRSISSKRAITSVLPKSKLPKLSASTSIA